MDGQEDHMTSITWRSTCRRTRTGKAAVATLLALSLMGAAGVSAGAAAPGADARASTPAEPAASPTLHLLGGKWGDKASDGEALDGGKVNKPDHDPGSLYTLSKAIGARKLWKHTDPAGRPLTGEGVTVAVLDSGVSAVPGLDRPGKVVVGPDFSGQADSRPDVDDFGHGTFMAGIIAAQDRAVAKDGKPASEEGAAPEVQQGLAPQARLLSLKLADEQGRTSVDAVIAALQWTVAHKDDNGLNVRVVNLSFGAEALQPYQVDPLAAAAEAAWHAGIVVVASVGNDGDAASVSDPALDPFVIAVGATDPRAKVSGWGAPDLASFSQRAASGRRADLVAPGTSVVSLRVPGSTIDAGHAKGRVSGDASKRLFRGSGTSEAAAVVSAAAALVLQAQPSLTPDQVKAALVRTASKVKGESPDAGAGQVDVEAALRAVEEMDKNDKLGLASAVQRHEPSTGLEGASLGELSGEWNGARWNGARWNGARWNGARWNGARWNGGDWS